MLNPLAVFRWTTLCSAALLAACGGGSGDGAAAPTPTPPTTLVLSVSSLALKTSGIARTVTVTNTGGAPTELVTYALGPTVPAGTTAISSCSTLAPGASCEITITPGATASAATGNLSPVPINLDVSGTNTNVASAAVHVLGFGSVYQSGYVFSFDDTTPATGSVGGKAAGLNDVSVTAMQWSGATDNTVATSNTDGMANTQALVAFYTPGVPATTYAAGACSESADGGRTDWYLPAICEMGYDNFLGGSSGCGDATTPLIQNMQSNLIDGSNLPGPALFYWSSTQRSQTLAWTQEFSLAGGSHTPDDKADAYLARCVRPLTP